jgi:hypothetical protein
MSTTTMASPESPEKTATILTLTHQHREGQALQQYAYDPAVIDQAVMLGDMTQMTPAMRLEFYKAVCLSVGLNPLTQPFTVLKRQDGTTWLYANSSCTQQLASLHRVSFRDVEREHVTLLGDPLYVVRVTAVAPDGRAVPSQAVVSLTKKKREVAGHWPSGDPKFRDVLDKDAEPVLIPLRGESLANALMRADTKGFRRATLALVGLGWMQSEFEGRAVAFNLQTGALEDDRRLLPAIRHLDTPEEQAKTTEDHSADLYGDRPPVTPLAGAPADPHLGLYHAHHPHIEALVLAQPGWNVEAWDTWAVRRFRKPVEGFTQAEWQEYTDRVERAIRERPWGQEHLAQAEREADDTPDKTSQDASGATPTASPDAAHVAGTEGATGTQGPSWGPHGPQGPDLFAQEEREAEEYGE